ncbi:MAG TPA: hypothetical protein VMH77_09900 [Steroidobacteraceae bacterium]|nr:hypothetical protein [Steroidobacteraceae bacterium]
MLRVVVMLLLAANVLYFGWSHWAVQEKPMLTAVAPGGHHDRPQATPAAAPPCATLGPFHDEEPALQAEQQLASAGWHPQRRDTSEDVNDGWWVYVPNADAAAQARTLDALRRSGARDATAMPDDVQFRVSVGLYSDQQRAQERASRLQRLKLDAVVQEHQRQQPAIWFDLPGVTGEALREAHLDGAGLPLDALRIENCPTAVPATTTPATPAPSLPAAKPTNEVPADGPGATGKRAGIARAAALDGGSRRV